MTMSNFNISFGRKIPVGTCILRKNDAKVPARIYELDGKDQSDIKYFENAPGQWEFKKGIASDISTKHSYPEYCDSRFYSIENQDGKILGMTECSSIIDGNTLDYIESKKHGGYKYIGTALMAVVMNQALEEGVNNLHVPDPKESAKEFYKNKCGFTFNYDEGIFETDRTNMKRFIKNAQETIMLDIFG